MLIDFLDHLSAPGVDSGLTSFNLFPAPEFNKNIIFAESIKYMKLCTASELSASSSAFDEF